MATKGKDKKILVGQITFDFYTKEAQVKKVKTNNKKDNKAEKKLKPVKAKHLKLSRKIK